MLLLNHKLACTNGGTKLMLTLKIFISQALLLRITRYRSNSNNSNKMCLLLKSNKFQALLSKLILSLLPQRQPNSALKPLNLSQRAKPKVANCQIHQQLVIFKGLTSFLLKVWLMGLYNLRWDSLQWDKLC
jgi:hypothetical protein